MPLIMLEKGRPGIIKSANVPDATKRFLKELGIVEGSQVSVVSENCGNVILQVLGSRIAISKQIALHLQVNAI